MASLLLCFGALDTSNSTNDNTRTSTHKNQISGELNNFFFLLIASSKGMLKKKKKKEDETKRNGTRNTKPKHKRKEKTKNESRFTVMTQKIYTHTHNSTAAVLPWPRYPVSNNSIQHINHISLVCASIHTYSHVD